MSGLDKRLSTRLAKDGKNGKPSPLAALQQLQEAAQAAQELPAIVEQAKALVEELQRSRENLAEATETIAGLSYELVRQRAVFLRILYSPNCLLPPGPQGMIRLMETEERFRAEYDGMHLLLQTLAFLPEGP